MKYSYIKPRNKTALTTEMQLLFVFFGVSVLMLFMTYLFLIFREYRFAQDLEEIAQQKQEVIINTQNMQKRIERIEQQSMLCEKIFTKNSVLKDSINNMFDLVPSRITLSEAKILENGLILYGITPNKDIYNFMLQAPLRSIFHKSYSSFYPQDNGWYKFVSTNYIDEELLNEY